MKFCTKCGKQLLEGAVICPGCGCAVENSNVNSEPVAVSKEKAKTSVSLILGIIGAVAVCISAIAFIIMFCMPYSDSYSFYIGDLLTDLYLATKIIGVIPSITGIIFGIKEYKETNKMVGLAISIVSVFLALIPNDVYYFIIGLFR